MSDTILQKKVKMIHTFSLVFASKTKQMFKSQIFTVVIFIAYLQNGSGCSSILETIFYGSSNKMSTMNYENSDNTSEFETKVQSMEISQDLIHLALHTFSICNTDDSDGLTWTEFKSCKVRTLIF